MKSLEEMKQDQARLRRRIHQEEPRRRAPGEVDEVFKKLRASLAALGLPFRIGITPVSEADSVPVQSLAPTGPVTLSSATSAYAVPDTRDDADRAGTDLGPYWNDLIAPRSARQCVGEPVEF